MNKIFYLLVLATFILSCEKSSDTEPKSVLNNDSIQGQNLVNVDDSINVDQNIDQNDSNSDQNSENQSKAEIKSIEFNGTLYVYPEDNSTAIRWYNGRYVETKATSETDGKTNTATIIAAQGEGESAACLCDTLTGFGYDDWYLPSIDELHAIALKKDSIGGFENGMYWSSTEINQGAVYAQRFYDGPVTLDGNGDTIDVISPVDFRKQDREAVRCVRR